MQHYDSTQDYPRDLIGYGPKPPHAQWPNQARVAVQTQFSGTKCATATVALHQAVQQGRP